MTDRAVVAVSVEDPAWSRQVPRVVAHCRRAVLAALDMEGLGRSDLETSVVLTGDDAVQRLNCDYRGSNYPTNVLAFPLCVGAMPLGFTPRQPGPVLLGDIVVAYETTVREAAAEGKLLADHLSHLVVHGMLHLLGYDHDSARAARRMEGLETRILLALDVPAPYGEEAEA